MVVSHSSLMPASFSGSDICFAQVGKNFCGGVVVKADVNAAEILVDYWCAEKTRGGSFFGGIARHREKFSASGKDRAGNFSLKRLKKCDLALDEREVHGVMPNIEIADEINFVGIYAQCIQRIVDRVRGLRPGAACANAAGTENDASENKNATRRKFFTLTHCSK